MKVGFKLRIRPCPCSERAQALTETLLIMALVALVVAGVAWVWRAPLSAYLNRLLQAVAATR